MEEEGVDLDEDISNFFSNVLERSNLTPNHALFLEEQLKYATASNPRAHRWHPAILLFAISIRSKSPNAYEALRDSGFVKLPHSRTLFDYTHYIQTNVGVSSELLKLFAEKVRKADDPNNQYHALIFDEMQGSLT